MQNSVILRIADAKVQKGNLSKLVGNVSLANFCDLISSADLEANPREAKKSSVTQAIEDSLANESDIFQFMTKGVLVAAQKVDELDRNRYRLTFEDSRLEGILDGGHNTLAIGRYVLHQALLSAEGETKADAALSRIRHWEDLKQAWELHKDLIASVKESLNPTLVPIEIIYPTDDAEGIDVFRDKILKINAARNNNAQLTVETRANQKGIYDPLKLALDKRICKDVEWKANDGGRLKARDIVALSLIPLSKLGFDDAKSAQESPTIIFSQKGLCVEIYNKIMSEKNGVVAATTGEIVELVDEKVGQALSLMADIPRLFDLIYELLPDAYNSVSPGFGRIRGVKIYGEGAEKYKENKEKYLRKAPVTRFYQREVKYDYGEGYIYPIVVALGTLIEVGEHSVRWKTNPDDFLRKNLPEVMLSYRDMIVAQAYDPARVGKMSGAYNVVARTFESALQAIELRQLRAQVNSVIEA